MLCAAAQARLALASRRQLVNGAVAPCLLQLLTPSSNAKDIARQRQMSTKAAPSDSDIIKAVKEIVPALSGEKSKGQSGCVGTIGGCREYTGAPFFASMSALRIGADLSHVFCTSGAATVIKTYGPDLIVHPYVPDSTDYEDQEMSEDRKKQILDRSFGAIQHWLPRFNVMIIGPGLGRDEMVHDTIKQVILNLREAQKPLVIDADGLYIVTRDLSLVKGYKNAVLTPNKAEFGRLADQLKLDVDAPDINEKMVAALEGPMLVRKGKRDAICTTDYVVEGPAEGSPRRAGGQGDVMSGSIATFLGWAHGYLEATGKTPGDIPPAVLAAYGGCSVARRASKKCFAIKKRSMIAVDLIEHLGHSVDELYDQS